MRWMPRLLAILISVCAFAAGMWAAHAMAGSQPRSFLGSYRCENFGLPDRSFPNLRIDGDLQVYGTSGSGKPVHVGRLDPRGKDLAYFDLKKETITWKSSPLDPLAEYIVDNAGDAILILEMQNERAKMSYVCRRI